MPRVLKALYEISMTSNCPFKLTSERASRRDNMTKEDKLKKALTKFLNKYSWGAMEHLEKDNGIGVGYFDEEDEPQHVREVNELYELLNESEQKG